MEAKKVSAFRASAAVYFRAFPAFTCSSSFLILSFVLSFFFVFFPSVISVCAASCISSSSQQMENAQEEISSHFARRWLFLSYGVIWFFWSSRQAWRSSSRPPFARPSVEVRMAILSSFFSLYLTCVGGSSLIKTILFTYRVFPDSLLPPTRAIYTVFGVSPIIL